jgi:hypothetical protein
MGRGVGREQLEVEDWSSVKVPRKHGCAAAPPLEESIDVSTTSSPTLSGTCPDGGTSMHA